MSAKSAAALPVAPGCQQSLAVAGARLEQARAHLKGRQAGGEACATYRRHFFEVVKAREVTAMCKTGTERERELSDIDAAVENLNGAIARTCSG